jgi:hypothetical protein
LSLALFFFLFIFSFFFFSYFFLAMPRPTALSLCGVLALVCAATTPGVSAAAAAWPMRKGGVERQGYLAAGDTTRRFDSFSASVSKEVVCGSWSHAKVNDLALTRDAHVIASNAMTVASIDNLGDIAWTYPRQAANASVTPTATATPAASASATPNATATPSPNATATPSPNASAPATPTTKAADGDVLISAYASEGAEAAAEAGCAFFTSPAVGLAGDVFVGTASRVAQSSGKKHPGLKAEVLRLSAESGSEVWRTTLPAPNGTDPAKTVLCSDVALSPSGDTVYIGCSFGAVVALYKLDGATGVLQISEASRFIYDGKVEANEVGEVLPSASSPGRVYLTTEFEFFSCETGRGEFQCWNVTYPKFGAQFRLAESASGAVIIYSYEINSNTIYAVDLKSQAFAFEQEAGTKQFQSDGAIGLHGDRIYALEKNQLVALNFSLAPVWIANHTSKSAPGSDLVLDDKHIYVYDSKRISVFSHEAGKEGVLISQINTPVKSPPLLNYFRSPALSAGPTPALFIPAANRVVAFVLGTLGPVVAPSTAADPDSPSLSGGTVAAIVIMSCVLGIALFGAVYYLNSQREAYAGHSPLI